MVLNMNGMLLGVWNDIANTTLCVVCVWVVSNIEHSHNVNNILLLVVVGVVCCVRTV